MKISTLRIIILLASISFWPVWKYIYQFSIKAFDGSILMLLFILGYFVYDQKKWKGNSLGSLLFFYFFCAFNVLYIGSFHYLPNLFLAFIAFLSLAMGMLSCYPVQIVGKKIALLILVPLCLPLGDSLQFAVGYPMRLWTTKLAAFLLYPYEVKANGTTLYFGLKAVEVDIPCSGVHGVWSFLLMAGILGLLMKYNFSKLLQIVIASLVCGLIYNVLRSSMLFMGKVHLGEEGYFMHNLIGIVAMIVGMGLLVGFLLIQKQVYNSTGKKIKQVYL